MSFSTLITTAEATCAAQVNECRREQTCPSVRPETACLLWSEVGVQKRPADQKLVSSVSSFLDLTSNGVYSGNRNKVKVVAQSLKIFKSETDSLLTPLNTRNTLATYYLTKSNSTVKPQILQFYIVYMHFPLLIRQKPISQSEEINFTYFFFTRSFINLQCPQKLKLN